MRPIALVVVAACGRVGFDGSPRDAHPGDAGATHDASGDAVLVDPCAAGSYLLCDGFEAGTLASVWTADPNAALDPTVAHRGSQSVHVRIPATQAGTGAYATIIESKTLLDNASTFYVRAYLRLGALPAGSNGMEVIAAETMTSSDEDAVFLHATGLQLYEQWTDMVTNDTPVPSIGSWFCLIFVVQRAANGGTLELAGDPAGLTLTNVPTDGMPTLQHITFGLQLAGTNQPADQPAIDAWYDDIIVDKSPVTCAD